MDVGGNEDVKMDEWSHQAGQNKELKNTPLHYSAAILNILIK